MPVPSLSHSIEITLGIISFKPVFFFCSIFLFELPKKLSVCYVDAGLYEEQMDMKEKD